MKLENCIVDMYDDINLRGTIQKIASHIPEELKSKSLPTIEERNSLDDSQFALCVFTKSASKLNKFPINDKLNTALSNEYFELNHGKLPAEAQKIAATYIKTACDRFGIKPTESVKLASLKFPTITNIYFENEKSAPAGELKTAQIKDPGTSSDHYYALTKQAGDGQATRAYALPDVAAIKKAEAYFDKYASHFSPEDRHQFAYNVVKRAVELGAQVESGTIHKYAGFDYNPAMEAHLVSRKKLVEGNDIFVNALDKLAAYKSETDPVTFAKVLHEFDKRAGLVKYYDKYLADPYLSTFNATKIASVIYEIDGLQVKEGDIEKVANEKYSLLKTYFGPTLADGLKKEGSAAFTALPDDAKEVIARMVHGEIQ